MNTRQRGYAVSLALLPVASLVCARCRKQVAEARPENALGDLRGQRYGLRPAPGVEYDLTGVFEDLAHLQAHPELEFLPEALRFRCRCGFRHKIVIARVMDAALAHRGRGVARVLLGG